MINFLFDDYFGDPSDGISFQYHRARERCMNSVRPSLRRLVTETEKERKVKLGMFTFIREFCVSCHAAKVLEAGTNRRYYISLMLGPELYLEEFDPGNLHADSIYVIAGLSSSKIIITADRLREVFRFIPDYDYDLSGRRCYISKEKFCAGFRRCLKEKQKQKQIRQKSAKKS